MEHLSTTPALTNDLSAYVAALAARVDRLEQQNRSQQRPREHVHPFGHNASEYDEALLANCYNPHRYFGLPTGQHSHSVSKAA